MNKIKLTTFITIFLLINHNVFCQQFYDFSFLEINKSDSVTISKISYRNREFIAPLAVKIKPAIKDSITGKWSLPYSDSQEVKDTVFTISTTKLSKIEILNLNRLLKIRSSYSKKAVVLMSHYDIEIRY